MCGIAGIFRFDGQLPDPALVPAMLQAQKHRGPDGSGTFTDGPVALGHLRLSIIDLSEAAGQPMQYGDRYTISFNGEIYNYLELRAELSLLGYTFRTSSDTEVILAAYDAWGEACVGRFIGMWAFALWDARNGRLFCSRDRFGIKPFHYIRTVHELVFASEVKALRCHPRFSGGLEPVQTARFLQFGWLYHDAGTMLADVKVLPAGHNLMADASGMRTVPYWTLPARSESAGDRELPSRFRDLFFDSVRLQLRSDVPVGACLSGGLDSSSIVCTLRRLEPEARIKTFSAYYGNGGFYDERNFIRMVVESARTDAFYTSPGARDVQASLDDVLDVQDFPIGSSSPLSQYFVMKRIADAGIKVVLDGQGADEFLGGYLHFYFRYFSDLLRNRKYGAYFKNIARYSRSHSKNLAETGKLIARSAALSRYGERFYFEKAVSAQFDTVLSPEITAGAVLSFLPEPGDSQWSDISRMEIMDTTLPTLLHLEDRNSMRFSLESRVPFLDHRLVELAATAPVDAIVDAGWTKKILREAMRGVLPEEIRTRRDKRGFVTPGEVQWLDSLIDQQLASGWGHAAYNDFIDAGKADALLRKVRAGDARNRPLAWRLVMLHRWVSRF